MKIAFKNLGPLHECEVELADLTIVTGHNNTGKTYVTYGVYGLLSGWRHWIQLPRFHELTEKLMLTGKVVMDLKQFTGNGFRHQLSQIASNYRRNLAQVLAAEPDRFQDTTVHLDLPECADATQLIINLQQTLPHGDNVAMVKAAGATEIAITRQAATQAGIPVAPAGAFLERWIAETVIDLIFQPCFPRIYIASTERTGAAIFQRELNLGRNRLIETLADLKAGEAPDPFLLLQRMSPSYALPVQQNVEFLSPSNLEPLGRQQGPLAKEHPELLDALDELAGGTYKVTKQGTYFTPNKQRGLKLRLGECSSAVRSLLDVSYYIRHVLRPGDYFVIDEPELNLHPQNQRRFARLIGRLVNAGVKVFLTTHSDYVIRELNTLILLAGRGQTKTMLLEQLDYDEKELIPATGVRFYRTGEALRKNDGKTRRSSIPVLEKVSVDAKTGIAVQSFDIEIDNLNEIQDAIIYTPEIEAEAEADDE